MLFLFNFFFAVGLLAIPWLCRYQDHRGHVHRLTFDSAG
jgi:hypothetical protein